MVYQSNPSPFKHSTCFSELPSAFAFSGMEADNYQLPVDRGDDFVVPDVFFSPPPPPPQQLIFPTMPAESTTLFPPAAAAGISDVPVLDAQIADHHLLMIHDYGANFSSANCDLQQLGIIRNWEIERERKHAVESESSSAKVGRYSVEERRDRILRYLKKRNHRNFNKTIKYACRKTLADRRIRVRGRFAKNNDDANDIKHTDMSPLEDTISPSPYYDQPYDNTQQMMRQDGEGWLQEAITNLMYNIPPWQGGFALNY